MPIQWLFKVVLNGDLTKRAHAAQTHGWHKDLARIPRSKDKIMQRKIILAEARGDKLDSDVIHFPPGYLKVQSVLV